MSSISTVCVLIGQGVLLTIQRGAYELDMGLCERVCSLAM